MLDAPAARLPGGAGHGGLRPHLPLRRALAAMAVAARRAGLRRRHPLPLALLAAALLTAPAVWSQQAHPTATFLGLDAAVAGALAVGIGAIALLDLVTHRDRRGVANVILGTALSMVTVARLVLWALAVEGRLAPATASADDAWFFGTIVLAMPPVLAWGAVRQAHPDRRPGTGLAGALGTGVLLGAALVGAAVAMWSAGGAVLDHATDALGLAAAAGGLAVVLWSVHRGVQVRMGTRPALLLVGVAGLAEAVSGSVFDSYWYAAHLSLLLALGCVFVGKARLVGVAMRVEHQHLWELEVLHGAAERLAATLDVEELRATVVDLAVQVLTPLGSQPLRSTLVRVDDGLFEVVSERDDGGCHLAGAVFPQSSFPDWKSVVHTRQTRAVEIDPTRLGLGARAAVRRSGVRAQIVAPVTVGGVVVGLLTAGTRAPYRFSAAEIAALRGIANLAGLAFDNAWRYTDEHRLVDTLYQLAAANTETARADGVDAVLEHVAEAAAQLTGARSAAIVLQDEDGATPHVVTTGNRNRALLERLAANLGGGRLAVPVPGSTAPFRMEDVRRTATPEIRDALESSGVRVFLGVPLLHKENPAGVLYVAGRSEPPVREFGPNDEAVLVALAAHAMVAVENVRMMRRLAEASVLDPLTGLGNRREFERVRRLRPRAPFAVLAIDVDNLKVINDEAGHEAGDAVLRAVGTTLAHAARPDDLVMRVGGDEFVLLVEDAGLGVGCEVGERIRCALRAASVPHGQACVSIGVAAGEPGDEVDAVWGVADVHLYRAKASGRDRLVAAGTAPGTAPRWEQVVRGAIQPGGLRTVFQPIVDLGSGCVAGFEALSRPRETPPGESVEGFFAAAQRLGMMRDVDWLCRRVALDSATRLPAGTTVFLNVSTGALLDPVLAPDQMELLVASLHLDPRQVVLELTERELVPDLVRLAEVLDGYRRIGFRFALDDVGTGRSTLGLLVAGKPEFLKIAGNIVASATGDAAAEGLVDAAIAFARRTGATVIAEGIEEAAVAERLRARGVTLGQGYGLFRPMELEDARRLAERER